MNQAQTNNSISLKQAYNYCIYLLSNREYSTHNLKNKITQKYIDLNHQDILDIINKLKKQDYLSDIRYAQIRSRSLIRKLYGPYYINRYLQQENIDKHLIASSIQNCLLELDIDWVNQINKYLIKYNYNFLDNSHKYKNKWRNKLYNRGFESCYINKIIF